MRILIVEDEPLMAKSISNKCKRLGHEVTAITEGEDQAIQLHEKHKPDLVIMDMFLKNGASGKETAIKMNTDGKATPVIFVTADLSPGLEKELKACLFPYQFLIKPIKTATLERRLEQFVLD